MYTIGISLYEEAVSILLLVTTGLSLSGRIWLIPRDEPSPEKETGIQIYAGQQMLANGDI